MTNLSIKACFIVLFAICSGCGKSIDNSSESEPVLAKEPTQCEIIIQGRDDAVVECNAGKFGKCQEIAGWTAEIIMQGCSSSQSDSASEDVKIDPEYKSYSKECARLAEMYLSANDNCKAGIKSHCEQLDVLSTSAGDIGCSKEYVNEAIANRAKEADRISDDMDREIKEIERQQQEEQEKEILALEMKRKHEVLERQEIDAREQRSVEQQKLIEEQENFRRNQDCDNARAKLAEILSARALREQDLDSLRRDTEAICAEVVP